MQGELKTAREQLDRTEEQFEIEYWTQALEQATLAATRRALEDEAHR